jgi:CheY-like chemotaxis protein
MMASYHQVRMPRAGKALRCQATLGKGPSSCSSKTTRRRGNGPGGLRAVPGACSALCGQQWRAGDKVRAADWLRRFRPSLILLDLNLPIRNGLAVLAELKDDTKFLSIPIVVLITFQAPDDIEQCYSLHANAYIVKPSDFDGFADVIKQIATCFLGLISLSP